MYIHVVQAILYGHMAQCGARPLESAYFGILPYHHKTQACTHTWNFT